MSNKNIDLIRQALGAAESSIKLAKQLLTDMESGRSVSSGGNNQQKKAAVLPGVAGVYDGESMVTESGEKFPVPENYSSKSMLVVGDTLKLVEEGKEKRFKQIEHVKRHKSTGILTKKDGKWRVITPEGSYKVLSVSVDHYGGQVGDEVILHIPANNLTVPFGAIESIKNKSGQAEQPDEVKPEIKPESKIEEKPEKKEATPKETTVKELSKEKAEKEPVKEKTVVAPIAEKKPEVKSAAKVEKSQVVVAPKPEIKTPPAVAKEEKKVVEKPAPTPVEIPIPEPNVETPQAAPQPITVPASGMEVSPEEEELT